MKILAADLQRLCYNAIQFSSKDSSLGGVVWFITQPNDGDGNNALFDVYASDDYVAMVDQAPMTTEKGTSFHLGLKEVKEVEKALRTVDGEIEIEVNNFELCGPWEAEVLIVSEPPDFAPVVDVVWSEPNPLADDYYPASRQPFAIRAERFAKFRLLRTPESPSCKDGYPVDFLWDGHLVRFKIGPYMKGVVAPLTRVSFVDQGTGGRVTGITELYADEEGVLW